MSKKYKTLISIVLLCLVFLFILYGGYKFYIDNNFNETIVVKLKDLSVNYNDGQYIKTTKSENNYSISITNDSNNEELYFSINIDSVKNFNKNVKMSLVSDNNKLDLKIKNNKVNQVINTIKISKGETYNYKFILENPDEKPLRFKINVIEDEKKTESIAKYIINSNDVKSSSLTVVGSEAAVNDEGLITDLDDSGMTYYFRGNVKNNYFKFADKMWRIVRINGNESVRLILDENVEVLQAFGENALPFNESLLKKALDDWYSANLFNYQKYLYEDKFCYDDQLSNDNTTYIAYNRNVVSFNPSFNCTGSVINGNIGLLSVDEAIYAGLISNSSNTNSYLYNDKIGEWWTMTPSSLKSDLQLFSIKNDGTIVTGSSSKSQKVLRPVINLSPFLTVIGSGTVDDPYVIK